MKKTVKILILFILFISCGTNNECTNRLPNRTVQIYISKNLPEGIDLRNKGFFIVKNQGIQGVIIYNSSRGYKAYDLASPHLSSNDECSKMSVKDGWFLENTCDGALFLMETGGPHNDKSPCSLKEYLVTEDLNSITVVN